jgi:uncharacterized protein YyaL (SSP411 family)
MKHPENRLASETSPYLRQHAHNPVDWYPWGSEALARARSEQKPIFLSIGYAACHWCHVMERESFEDPEVADLLNRDFISIKVDREERPELDQIYMQAVVALTRHGGWPMSVFLTPEGEPFYAGTYFPPEDRHGMPSFRRVLHGVAAAWRERRAEVLNSAQQLTAHLREMTHYNSAGTTPDLELLRSAEGALARAFDPAGGGFGPAPKFPHPLELRLLLRLWRRWKNPADLEMATVTLDQMAAGGIYDQLGGGFHRYSTDARWLVPHFEKMLYDNALLALAYLDAWQITSKPRYREVIEETLDWALREMTGPEGAFCSSLDADSEGEEGKFYVWSSSEVESVLGTDAELFSSVYDVSAPGNWEGKNILHRAKTDEQEARLLGMSVAALQTQLQSARRRLWEARARRVRPGRDDKYLAAWNSLMIAALARAGQVLDGKYVAPAARALDFVLTAMRDSRGRLYRTAGPGIPARLNGYLEDYAFTLNALIELYEATFELRWLAEARQLATLMLELFWDEAEGGFFVVSKDHETLIVRGHDPHDNAVPSGNSVAALALLRLGRILDNSTWAQRGEQVLERFAGQMAAMPLAFGQMLAAVDFALGPVREYVVVGSPRSPGLQEVLRLVRGRYEPNRIMVCHEAAAPGSAVNELTPLLAGKAGRDEAPVVYLCENGVCAAPLVGAAAVAARLAVD